MRGLGRRTREEIITEKWDQTDSPEVPNREETSKIPDLPSGDPFISINLGFE